MFIHLLSFRPLFCLAAEKHPLRCGVELLSHLRMNRATISVDVYIYQKGILISICRYSDIYIAPCAPVVNDSNVSTAC